MRATFCILCVCGLLLGGCGRALRSVAGLAENARTATEQMAATGEASNVRREIEIYPDAASLRAKKQLKLSQRYEMREGPGGYMVYDTENHTIARIGSQSEAGLTLDQAKLASEALSYANEHQDEAEPKGSPVGAPP